MEQPLPGNILQTMNRWRWWIAGLIYSVPALIILPASGGRPLQDDISGEEKTARKYCGSCHQFPEPGLFTAATWREQILPRMALFMGIYPNDSMRLALSGLPAVFPETPMIQQAEWEKIQHFYQKNALKTAKNIDLNLKAGLPGFKVRLPSEKIIPPGTCMAQFGENGQIMIGDVYAQKLFWFDSSLTYLRGGRLGEGVVDFHRDSQNLWFTVMGSFSPTDNPSGYLLKINRHTGMGIREPDLLRRPVSTVFGELNGKPGDEFVIAEFGRYAGQLAWYEQVDDQTIAHTLMQRPGAISACIDDLDGDGNQDITALFGQGDEGIWAFMNQGRGTFLPRRLLQFSPANGSSSFAFCDFNQDSAPDILYTAGDNADFGPISKPWHGIYVYFNDRKGGFSQKPLFIPMPGCYKAVVNDFDGDGDQDMAAIAFFADYQKDRPGSFILFINDGKNNFEKFTMPEAADGRWIVMDMADPDGDGDQDLLLGNMVFDVPGKPELVEYWKNKGLPFIVLENVGKDK